MISKSISTSKKLSKVSTFAALLFTWLVPHCDDYGRMDADSIIVRGIVVPLMDKSVEEISAVLDELESVGLITRYSVKEEVYLQINQWEDHQTFRSDRPRIEKYPRHTKDIPRTYQRETLSTQVKLSKDKLREVKLSKESTVSVSAETSPSPKETTQKFFNDVSEQKETLSVGTSLWDFLEEISNNTGISKDKIWIEIRKFHSYWTELNQTGKKQRWQMQKTFEVNRRLATWFCRVGFAGAFTSKKGKGVRL